MKRCYLPVAVLAAILATACSGKDNPLAPAAIVPDCEKNHTAVLAVTNNSANLLPRIVSIDGVDYGLIAWQETRNFTLAASVPHNVRFYSPVNGSYISGSEGLILNQCATFAYSNPYDTGKKVTQD